MQYIDTGKDRPGGSDARFWKQYLSEEEGEPLFGFGADSPQQTSEQVAQPTDKPTADGEAA